MSDKDHKQLIESFNKNKKTISKYLLIEKQNPSAYDIWYAYSKCPKEVLKKLSKSGDKTADMFLYVKLEDKNGRRYIKS